MGQYITAQELNEALEEARLGRHDKLFSAVRTITQNLMNRYKAQSWYASETHQWEDIATDVVLIVIKVLPRLETKLNPFGYITQIIKNEFYARHKKRLKYETALHNFAKAHPEKVEQVNDIWKEH